MVRNRVLSFMSQWSADHSHKHYYSSSTVDPTPPTEQQFPQDSHDSGSNNPSPPPPNKLRSRSNSRTTKTRSRSSSWYFRNSSKTSLFNPLSDGQGPRPAHFHEVQEDSTPPAPSTPVPSSPVQHDHDHTPPALNDSPRPLSGVNGHSRTHKRSSSRPLSMIQTYTPPVMDVTADTIPELQPIFTFLNSHANKLYQEGYFLKLDDQNIRK
jgi:hypothetical protein